MVCGQDTNKPSPDREARMIGAAHAASSGTSKNARDMSAIMKNETCRVASTLRCRAAGV